MRLMHIPLIAVLASAGLLAACNGTGTDPDSPIDGTWVATQLVVAPDGGAPIDILAAGGTLTITVTETNATSGTLTLPASLNNGTPFNASMAGTAVLSSANTEVTFTQAADTFVKDLTWQRVGNTSLRVTNQTAGDDVFNVTLTRQ